MAQKPIYPSSKPRKRGFERTGQLVARQVRHTGEARGFAVSRLLTHWEEIVGSDIATKARPVDVKYSRHGLGATLRLLCHGADAPMLEMQREQIRERVNACYGHSAIAQVQITQTSAAGFAEAPSAFTPKPKKQAPKAPNPALTEKARALVADVRDARLREILETIGTRAISIESPEDTNDQKT